MYSTVAITTRLWASRSCLLTRFLTAVVLHERSKVTLLLDPCLLFYLVQHVGCNALGCCCQGRPICWALRHHNNCSIRSSSYRHWCPASSCTHTTWIPVKIYESLGMMFMCIKLRMMSPSTMRTCWLNKIIWNVTTKLLFDHTCVVCWTFMRPVCGPKWVS